VAWGSKGNTTPEQVAAVIAQGSKGRRSTGWTEAEARENLSNGTTSGARERREGKRS